MSTIDSNSLSLVTQNIVASLEDTLDYFPESAKYNIKDALAFLLLRRLMEQNKNAST